MSLVESSKYFSFLHLAQLWPLSRKFKEFQQILEIISARTCSDAVAQQSHHGKILYYSTRINTDQNKIRRKEPDSRILCLPLPCANCSLLKFITKASDFWACEAPNNRLLSSDLLLREIRIPLIWEENHDRKTIIQHQHSARIGHAAGGLLPLHLPLLHLE